MTDETQASGITLPRTDDFERDRTIPALRADAGEGDDTPTRGVFASLVRGDGDITGLVAYSIYKQHKLDWLRAFEAAHRRVPNEAELVSYLCGEATPRRLATYRHLADATLAGQEPQIDARSGSYARPSRPVPDVTPDYGRRSALMERSGLSAAQVAVYALIAVIFVVGVVLALRFTATPPR